MKRRFKLLTLPVAIVGTYIPVCTLASCSQQKSVADTAIDEFKKLTIIPHSSDQFLNEAPYEFGNVWNLSCYLRDRISKITGKNVFQDKYGNLVFDVPANDPTLESAPKIAIQAHMDMVFAYNPDELEFKPDPRIWKIALVDDVVDGKRVIHSDKYKTSIGADNGMGVAQILALIQHNEIKHGNLRFILTNCEENGSQGGSLLVNETYPDVLKDFYYVLNIDGEDAGDIFVACSGAVGSYYYINSDPTMGTQEKGYNPTKGENFFKIKIDGFPGGHSGIDMPKGRDSALRFMNGILQQLNTDQSINNIRLHSISTPGSTVYNSIAKTCEVVICSDSSGWETKTLAEVKTAVNKAFEEMKEDRASIPKEYLDYREDYQYKFDPKQYSSVTCEVTQYKPKYDVALSVLDTKQIMALQSEESLEYGIYAWPNKQDLAKLTGDQTSANIGPAEGKMTTNANFEYRLSSYSRSSNPTDVARFFQMNEVEAHAHGAKWKYDAKFEPWHVDSNKKLLELCKKGWVNAGLDESKLKVSRTHGGLECSFWHEAMEKDETKVGKTAIVSYGPQINDVHSFKETLIVDSVKTCIDTTIYILQHANELTIN